MEGSQGPSGTPEGWYEDPHDAGRLRWWDGEAWSEHTHEKVAPEPVSTQRYAAGQSSGSALSPDDFPMPTPSASTSSRKPYAALPWVAAIAAVILGIGLLALAFGRGGDDEEDAGDTPVAATADADAKALARTAQTAIETYSTDNDGSYENASADQLALIEPILIGANLAVEGAVDGYTVSVTSETGTAFSVTRNPDGTVTFACTAPGTGGCPAEGSWTDY